MRIKEPKSVAIIVTHPDEETLWAGGTILSHPEWNCFIVCLTSANNPELSPRFYNALKVLKSEGVMGNLDEKRKSKSKKSNELDRMIIQLLPNTRFDIIITSNNFNAEANDQQSTIYQSVIKLWKEGFISAKELWTYDSSFVNPNSEFNAKVHPHVTLHLSKNVWSRKKSIMTRIFGYNENRWNSRNSMLNEEFWKIEESNDSQSETTKFGNSLNIFRKTSIEALKFLYHKSTANVYNKSYWKIDESDSIVEANENFADKHEYNYDSGLELNVFRTPSIDFLKSMYYNSIHFLFDKKLWKSESNFSEYALQDNENVTFRNDINHSNKKELKIFKNSTIEGLKSIYSKSMAYVFEKNKFDNDVFLNKVDGENTNDRESDIYNPSSIDNLEKLYFKKRGENQ